MTNLKYSIVSLLILMPLVSKAYDLIPMWESRRVVDTATFYTTYYNDHRSAQEVDGHEDHGVVAWVPCSNDSLNGPNGEISYKGAAPNYLDTPPGDWITPSRYSHGYTAAMNFACAKPAGSLPLYSMYKPAPQTDFIYTTSVQEFNLKKSAGYGFGRVEGYVFSTQVSSSVPLYRLSIGTTIANHDAEHRYVISSSARQSLLNAGWTDEGITGYVFASNPALSVAATQFTGTYNGYNISPTTTVNVPIQNVVPTTATLTLGGNSKSIQYGVYGSNSTTRPAGAVWQNMSFNIYTGALFSQGTTLNHIPFYLRYASTPARTQLSFVPPYDGIGLVLVPSNTFNGSNCQAPTGGGQIFFELGAAAKALCLPNLTTPLAANTWYTISFSVSDSADVRVNVNVMSTGAALHFLNGSTTFTTSLASYYTCPISFGFGALSADRTYCANFYNVHGFKVNNTGYSWFPLVEGASNITGFLNNMRIRWLNSNLEPL